MKFLKKILTSAIGIFLAKKWIEYYEKKTQNKNFSHKWQSLITKILPFIKNYLNKK